MGPIDLALDFSTGYLLLYQLLFGTILGLLFARRKQLGWFGLQGRHARLQALHREHGVQLVAALSTQQRMLRGLGQAGRDTLKEARVMDEQLQEILSAQRYEALPAFQAKFHHLSAYLQQVATQTQTHLQLQVGTAPLARLLEGVQQATSHLAPPPVFFNRAGAQELQADLALLHKLLVSSLEHAAAHSRPGTLVQLHVATTQLGYPIASLQGQVRSIPALRWLITTLTQPSAPAARYVGATDEALTVPPEQPGALPLVTADHIALAHYGVVSHEEETDGTVTHSYVLPLSVRKVRPKSMDVPVPTEAQQSSSHPEAAAKEAQLLEAVAYKAPGIDLAKVQEALALIRTYHAHQKRKSGEPFYLHPIEVALLLLDYTQDEDALLAALLHDTVEDTTLTLDQLGVLCNPTVAALVDAVTKLDKGRRKVALSKEDNLKKLASQADTRALAIKIADRQHNMQTIQGHPSYEKQGRIAEETQAFFVPLALQVGWHEAARELARLVTQVLARRP